MDYWSKLMEFRPGRQLDHFDDPPLSTVSGALVRKCGYFMACLSGEVSDHNGYLEFTAEIAPTESAFSIRYADGTRQDNVGRRGLTAFTAEDVAYGPHSLYVPRSYIQSPSSLVHFENLPIWGSQIISAKSQFIPSTATVYNQRFLRIICKPDPDWGSPGSEGEVVLDLRHKVAIFYESRTNGEANSTSIVRSARFIVNPGDSGIEEQYIGSNPFPAH